MITFTSWTPHLCKCTLTQLRGLGRWGSELHNCLAGECQVWLQFNRISTWDESEVAITWSSLYWLCYNRCCSKLQIWRHKASHYLFSRKTRALAITWKKRSKRRFTQHCWYWSISHESVHKLYEVGPELKEAVRREHRGFWWGQQRLLYCLPRETRAHAITRRTTCHFHVKFTWCDSASGAVATSLQISNESSKFKFIYF